MDKYNDNYNKLKNKYKLIKSQIKNDDIKNEVKPKTDNKSKDWEFLDKVLYINLEERTDRRKEIEEELKFFPKDKVIRFNAIKDKQGHIGCSKSHIACLDIAIKNDWNNVMILEDDATFKNYKEGIKVLKTVLKNDWDVITLGNTMVEYDKDTYKLHSAQTTTGYIVNNHYFKVLRKNFVEGLKKLEETHDWNSYCVDQYWKKLQKKDDWYIIVPSLVIQRAGFSTIQGADVDYTNMFNN